MFYKKFVSPIVYFELTLRVYLFEPFGNSVSFNLNSKLTQLKNISLFQTDQIHIFV